LRKRRVFIDEFSLFVVWGLDTRICWRFCGIYFWGWGGTPISTPRKIRFASITSNARTSRTEAGGVRTSVAHGLRDRFVGCASGAHVDSTCPTKRLVQDSRFANERTRRCTSPARSEKTEILIRRKGTGGYMRSEAIFRAKEIIGNKYKLCQTVSKATRMLHISSRDTQATINDAFARIAVGSDLSVSIEAV
jgi:hypothetical protein